MSKANPYESPRTVSQRGRIATWKAYLMLNLFLVMMPLFLAGGIYAWLLVDAWQAALNNNGDPVTYHYFFWIAPSGYASIAAYFFVPNWLLSMYRR